LSGIIFCSVVESTGDEAERSTKTRRMGGVSYLLFGRQLLYGRDKLHRNKAGGAQQWNGIQIYPRPETGDAPGGERPHERERGAQPGQKNQKIAENKKNNGPHDERIFNLSEMC